jgi:hypothetical protein
MIAFTAGRRLIPLLVAVAVGGCGSPAAPRTPRPPAASLRVDNRGLSDVIVYAADGRVALRLGRVGSLERMRLPLPRQLSAAAMRLVVRSVESDQVFTAAPVLAGAGAMLELTVEPLLSLSTLSVLSYGALAR